MYLTRDLKSIKLMSICNNDRNVQDCNYSPSPSYWASKSESMRGHLLLVSKFLQSLKWGDVAAVALLGARSRISSSEDLRVSTAARMQFSRICLRGLVRKVSSGVCQVICDRSLRVVDGKTIRLQGGGKNDNMVVSMVCFLAVIT